LNHLDLAYLAGIFDGEGSISITKSHRNKKFNPTYAIRISVQMCNPYIPHLFLDTFGGSINCYEHKGNQLPHWHWHLWSTKAIPFLETLMPYLRLKKNEAELAIEFQLTKKNHHTYQGNGYSAEQVAVNEAQRILMRKLHDKSEVLNV